MAKKQSHSLSLIISTAVLSLCAVVAWEAMGYPLIARRYPLVITGLLALVTVLDLLKTLAASRTGQPPAEAGRVSMGAEGVKALLGSGVGSWLKFTILVALYISSLSALGYLLASFLMLLAFPLVMSTRGDRIIFATSLGLTALVYYIFGVLLRVPLPLGFWG